MSDSFIRGPIEKEDRAAKIQPAFAASRLSAPPCRLSFASPLPHEKWVTFSTLMVNGNIDFLWLDTLARYFWCGYIIISDGFPMAEDLYKEVRVISNPGSNKPLPRKATSKKTFSSIIEIAQLNKINDGELKEQGKERNVAIFLFIFSLKSEMQNAASWAEEFIS